MQRSQKHLNVIFLRYKINLFLLTNSQIKVLRALVECVSLIKTDIAHTKSEMNGNDARTNTFLSITFLGLQWHSG